MELLNPKYMLRVAISGDVVMFTEAGQPVEFETVEAAREVATCIFTGEGTLCDLMETYGSTNNWNPEKVELVAIIPLDHWDLLDGDGQLMKVGADGQKMNMFRLAASGDRTGEPTSIKDVVSLSARATEVFGSREKAMRWLETEVPSLDNRTPLSLITSAEGMAEVEDVLGAIEHGAW